MYFLGWFGLWAELLLLWKVSEEFVPIGLADICPRSSSCFDTRSAVCRNAKTRRSDCRAEGLCLPLSMDQFLIS